MLAYCLQPGPCSKQGRASDVSLLICSSMFSKHLLWALSVAGLPEVTEQA